MGSRLWYIIRAVCCLPWRLYWWGFDVFCYFLDVLGSFFNALGSPLRPLPKPASLFSDRWFEFKRHVVYPACIIELFFFSTLLHRPCAVDGLVIPGLLGLLWSLGFIPHDCVAQWRLCLGVAFGGALRGRPLSILFCGTAVFALLHFLPLCYFSPDRRWLLSFTIIVAFWSRLATRLVFPRLRLY